MKLDNLPHFAKRIRSLREKGAKSADCSLQATPLFGSYHILYPIDFEDNVHWILKVPATGYAGRFDEIGARALASEAQTMQLIKENTTIVVPEILHYDQTTNNELECPYILMEFIDGKHLPDCWLDHAIPLDMLEQRRTKILQEVASTMIQLEKFVYEQSGQLVFNEHGQVISTGSAKVVDASAELARLDSDDDDLTAIFCEMGPFRNAADLFLALLDRQIAGTVSDPFSNGLHYMLHHFIRWAPFSGEQDFVLAHPDFDSQNFIVADDGSLRGVIDWDGVAAVPRCIGNRSFPGWLTRDWDPAMYAWAPGEDGQEDVRENSPEELTHYRNVYVEAIENVKGQDTSDSSLAQNSLIYENLYIAASNPACMHGIVTKIFTEIAKIVAPETLIQEIDAEALDVDSGDLVGDEDGTSDHDGGEALISRSVADAGRIENQSQKNPSHEDAATSTHTTNSEQNEDEEDASDGFFLYEVATALAENNLDAKRLGMLKEGFLQLFV